MTLLWVFTTGHLNQEEEVTEASYRQLKVAARSQALVLMGDFNHPDTCWNTRHTQSRRFLQSIDDILLTQGVEEITRGGVLLNLLLQTKKDWSRM